MNMEQAVGQIVIFHMSNGQPVIGKVAGFDEESGNVQVNRAMELMFVPHPQQPGRVTAQYTPYLSFGGILPALETMPINLGDTLLIRSGTGVPKNLEDGYLQATTSVKIPTASELSNLNGRR